MPKFTRLTGLALCLGLLAGCSTAPGAQQNISSPETTEAATAQAQQDTTRTRFSELWLVFTNLTPDGIPYICTRLANRPLISLLYQGLFFRFVAIPCRAVLCQRYVASDLKAYRFYLAKPPFPTALP